MPRRLLLLTLATILLAAAPAPASSSEICDRIFKSLERAESGSSLWSYFRGIWVPAGMAQPPADREPVRPFAAAEYWVTIAPGTARGPDCNQGLVRSIYYLPGLVVRPILDIGHGDVLLVTEHGLYAVVPRQHLAPVTEDSHYIFSDGVGDHRLCVNSAKLNPECDALLPSADSQARLHAIFSYVHGRNPSDMEERRRLYLSSYYDRRLPDREDARAKLCDRFNAGSLYDRKETTDPMPGIDQQPGYDMVSMSLCAYREPEPTETLALRAGIKIVTHEGAKESFSVAVPTVYLRRSDQILDLSKILDGNRSFRSRKECFEELSISDFQTAGLSGGLSIDTLISAGVKLEVERRTEFTQDFDDRMFIISAHTAQPDDLTSISQFFRRTYDIWSVYSCQNGSVSAPEKIVLYHQLPRDSFIEFDVQELRKEYERHYDKRGQPTRSRELDLYNDGYVWRYSDYQDYIQWRQHLRLALQDNPKIADLAEHETYRDQFNENPHLYMQLVDHFVHLTLTAAFFSDIEVPGRPRDREDTP
jgi:hypothetical protein